MFSSHDALGFLVDLLRAWRDFALARTRAAEKVVGDAASMYTGASCALRVDSCFPVDCRRRDSLEGLEPRTDSGRIGIGDSRALKNPCCRDCRCGDCSESSVAQPAAYRAVIGETSRIHAGAGRTDLAAVKRGTASLPRAGCDRRSVRGVSLSGVRDGRAHSGRAAQLECDITVVAAVRPGTPVSRTRRVCRDYAYWSRFWNFANCIRRVSSGGPLAHRCGCGRWYSWSALLAKGGKTGIGSRNLGMGLVY